ncbi:Ataxin-7-like protein 1 [Dissostichus eleginoides]|uniref:Ataxin-7-like protein 1 n=1 Tax=Dissostichus eleginoides TaxID=100907 RepID=A0AAD9CRS2_DISEL|nr:Ataxin-7-like protein 1 [Dissostichus eleginoides]
MKPKAPAVTPTVVPSPGDTLAFRVPKEYPHSRFSKAPLAVYPPKGARNKTCVSLPVVSLEKIPCLSRGDPSSHRSSEKLTNGRWPPTPRSTPSPSSSADRRPSPARSPLDRRLPSTPSPSPLDRKPPPSPAPSQRSAALPVTSLLEKKQQNGTKTSSRSQKRLSVGRVDRLATHRPYLPELVLCDMGSSMTHSLTHRRAVGGRGKHFDVLLAEHKGRETASPSRPHCTNGRTLSMLKLRLANAHIPRDGGRLSSDEGDAETPEDGDRSASHSSHRHPQPLRYCVFSSRLMGRGHYVFDRRWDRMRLALQNSVEKHLNAHMWRARNGTHKAPRSSKDTEDSGAKRRKNASSFFPTVDNLSRNGSSHHPTLQSSGASAAGRKKGLGRGGMWSGGEDWLSGGDGSESYNSHSSGELGSVPDSPSRESPSAPPHPPAPPPDPCLMSGGQRAGRGGVPAPSKQRPAS